MKRIVFVLFVCFLALTAVSCTDACAVFLEENDAIVSRFLDAAEVANNTPRMSLAPQITELQEIRAEYAALDVPECATSLHSKFLNSADFTIEAFLAFLSDGEGMDAAFDSAANWGIQYSEERREMSE